MMATNNMNRILLIDDDERMADPLQEYFARFDLQLSSATLPSSGLKLLKVESFDLVILDIMLPEMDGFAVCREIRKDNNIPILMLTARGEVTDRIVGLEMGADDYLPKPFEPRELVARINTIIKRTRQDHNPNPKVLEFEDFSIDLDTRQILVTGKSVDITHMEFEFLKLLTSAPGTHFNRDQILNHLRGIDAELYTRAVDNLVSRLRHKLKPANPIKTVWGSGYTFIGVRK